MLLFATPRYKGASNDYIDCRDETIIQCLGLGLPLVLYRGLPAMVDLARALICDEAVKHGGITDVLMVDEDMGWNPDDVIRLWANDKGVVAGVGRRKGALESNNPGGYAVKFLTAPGVKRKAFMQPHELVFPVDSADGMMEVEGVGAAFMRIRVDAIHKQIAAHPELIARVAMTTPTSSVERMLLPLLFKTGIFDGDYLLEDYSFCHRWRAMGEKVWIDPTMKIRHWGEHCWAGALVEGFKLKPKEPADVAAG